MSYNNIMQSINKLKDIFKNSFVEININHNEAINVFQKYHDISEKNLQTLVNFDTHSDIYSNSKNTEYTIANWVNYCFRNLNITEFFWIIPNYIKDDPIYKVQFETKKDLKINSPFFGFDTINVDLNKINHEEIFMHPTSGEIITRERINYLNNNFKKFGMTSVDFTNLKKISIYIICTNNLKILNGKEILLSVDADYFCNSGFDTFNNINNKNISKEQLFYNFNTFINDLYEIKIKPMAVSLTYSPVYFPKKFYNELTDFYSQIKKASELQT